MSSVYQKTLGQEWEEGGMDLLNQPTYTNTVLEIPKKHVKGKPDWLVTPNFVAVCEETSSNPHSSDKIKHRLTFG